MLPFPALEVWDRLNPSGPFEGSWEEFRHREQGEFLQRLKDHAAVAIELGRAGSSEEGRALVTARLGNRAGRRVLVWARQHGNEPDCSAGLMMALAELALYAEQRISRAILGALDVMVLPMVNPDGVARFTRENAQGIDINRDAEARATAEGRALFALKESFQPEFAFNLHDMNPRRGREGDGSLVALALQAGPYNDRDEDNTVRLRAKAVCARIGEAAEDFAPENVARYRADYMPRAFGDSMMRWGVSSVLIEAGGWIGPDADGFVRRLFALALLRGLFAVAQNEDFEDADAAHAYAAIPLHSDTTYVDTLVAGGHVIDGSGRAAVKCDLSINRSPRCAHANGPVRQVSSIESTGHLAGATRAKDVVEATGLLAIPGLCVVAPNLEPGDEPLSDSLAAGFLRAGITTVACGFGPFAHSSDREAWADGLDRLPTPINVIPFEVVQEFDAIRARHGLTELAGFLVRGLVMEAEALHDFAHLFHPAVRTEFLEGTGQREIGIEMFMATAGSPGATRIRLHLTADVETSRRTALDPAELRRFCQEFLRHPAQISMSCASDDPPLGWLPVQVEPSGHGGTGAPPPDFLGRALAVAGGTTAPAGMLPAVATMLGARTARALRVSGPGRLKLAGRADLALYRWSAGAAPEAAALAPKLTMLNGLVVHQQGAESALPPVPPGLGTWFVSGE